MGLKKVRVKKSGGNFEKRILEKVEKKLGHKKKSPKLFFKFFQNYPHFFFKIFDDFFFTPTFFEIYPHFF